MSVHLNLFRVLGDLSHLLSFLILFYRLRKTRNATGISLKTQELYLLVFVTRYMDIFWNFSSLYNTLFKLFYLCASASIVYTIRYTQPYRSTYQSDRDTFLHWKFAVAPAAVLALLWNEGRWEYGVSDYFFEVCWAFSIWLEAIAIFPQLVLLTRDKEVENITSHYIASLGAYRALYIINWVWRVMTEPHYRAWLAWVAGALQTALYADFFYNYYVSLKSGAPLGL